jgi:molecular chaperone GrpE
VAAPAKAVYVGVTMSAVDNPAQEPGDAADAGRDPGGDLNIGVEVDTSEVPEAGKGAGRDARIAQLDAAVAKLEVEKKENFDKYLRAVADLENYRKRNKRDLDDARAEAKTKVLKEMLPVVDNLERAVEHAEKSQDPGAVVDGIRLVLRQFLTAFERVDVTPVDAANQPFDPNLHEAISQQETDEFPPGTVVTVLQRGYRLGDRLLRPALVVVAKAKPAPEGASA